ncbi:hypothetical protein GQ600_5169 [Phytophthora cactorum]|nr:hypothetical protein GQ600_5169 [Phytophthora cactorum]
MAQDRAAFCLPHRHPITRSWSSRSLWASASGLLIQLRTIGPGCTTTCKGTKTDRQSPINRTFITGNARQLSETATEQQHSRKCASCSCHSNQGQDDQWERQNAPAITTEDGGGESARNRAFFPCTGSQLQKRPGRNRTQPTRHRGQGFAAKTSLRSKKLPDLQARHRQTLEEVTLQKTRSYSADDCIRPVLSSNTMVRRKL